MKQFTKHNGERFNLSICLDQARRGPVHIEFFNNHAVMLSAHQFLSLCPQRLKELQNELRGRLQSSKHNLGPQGDQVLIGNTLVDLSHCPAAALASSEGNDYNLEGVMTA